MKNIKKLFAGLTLLAALPLSAANYVFVPGNNHAETKICIAAAENNLMKYKRNARSLDMGASVHRKVVNELKCNNESILDFASFYQADKTVKYLNRFSKHKVIISRELSDASSPVRTQNEETIYVVVN